MKVGIGISTRNRQQGCIKTLEAVLEYTPCAKHIAIADDFSCDSTPAALEYWLEKNDKAINRSDTLSFSYSTEQLGIAKNKNVLLHRLLADKSVDHIFLIEDDVRPKVANWQEGWMITAFETRCAHLLYLAKDRWGGIPYGNIVAQQGDPPYQVQWKPYAAGLLMYFTRPLLEEIGNFDERLANYGYEHNELSARALIAQGIRPDRYPHCFHAESTHSIEADDLNRKPMWNYAEMVERKNAANKNAKMYQEIMKVNLEKLKCATDRKN